jgi:hypothetical protein
MINWDWNHSNELVISMGPKMQPRVGGGTRPVLDKNNVRVGACASKSYLWSKRCLKNGRPPATRQELDGDTSTGLGLSHMSIASQALQAFMQRQTAKNGYDPLVWNQNVAQGHGVSVTAVGNGGATGHAAWIDRAIGTAATVQPSLKGPYVITVWGPTYFHSMALYSDYQCSFFDPEKGQFSYPRAEFKAKALEFLNADYPGLQGWDLWRPR